MVRLLLFRFWPVFLPLLVYWIWLRRARKLAAAKGEPLPRFSDGPWAWAVIASMGIAVVCFLVLGGSHGTEQGTYVPAHMENGQLVPGQVKP